MTACTFIVRLLYNDLLMSRPFFLPLSQAYVLIMSGILVLFSIAVWVTVKVLSRVFSSSTLDTIPGPSSGSFMTGKNHVPTYLCQKIQTRYGLGNFGRMFDRHGWNFVDDLGENYGSVVRLMGPMGVSFVFSSSFHKDEG